MSHREEINRVVEAMKLETVGMSREIDRRWMRYRMV